MNQRDPSSHAVVEPVDPVVTEFMGALEQIATHIGQLERMATDPLLDGSAEPLRKLILRFRSTLDVQFDMVAANTQAYPCWRARSRRPPR